MKKAIFILFIFYPAVVFSDTVEKIVAVVNDDPLLLSDLRREEAFYGTMLPFAQQVNAQVEHRLLLNEAKRFAEPPPEKEVDQEWDTLVRRFKNETEFQMKLQEMGMNRDALRTMIADRLWVKTFLDDRIGFFIFIGDDEVRYAREQREIPLSEQDETIRASLKAEKEKVKTREYIEGLKSRAKIRIYP